jgi:hypothetical protein
MSEPSFSMIADDDLPRTIRREREAREREAREREMLTSVSSLTHDHVAAEAPAATVRDFDVPFIKLMLFFVKAAFAAIPALLLLTVLLWLFGQGLQAVFPQLMKMQILINVPPVR